MKKYSEDQIDAMVKRVMAVINCFEIQAVAKELGITGTNLRNKVKRRTIWKDIAKWANHRGVSQSWLLEGVDSSRNLTHLNSGPRPPDPDARARHDLEIILGTGGPLAQFARDCLSNLVSAVGEIHKGKPPNEIHTEAKAMRSDTGNPTEDEDTSLVPAADGTHGPAAGRTRD